MKVGRPTLRTPELVDELCNRVASGRSVDSICNDADMPDQSAVYRWRHESPEFNERLSRAREDRKESTHSKMVELADRVLVDMGLDPQRAKCTRLGHQHRPVLLASPGTIAYPLFSTRAWPAPFPCAMVRGQCDDPMRDIHTRWRHTSPSRLNIPSRLARARR